MKKGERCPLNTSKALPRPGAKPQGLFSAINKHKVSYLFVAPYLLLFVLFTVLPVLIAVVLSFTSFNVLEPPLVSTAQEIFSSGRTVKLP